MKSINLVIPFFALGLIFTSCKDNSLSPKHLTNVSVVRETVDNNNNESKTPVQPIQNENNYIRPTQTTPESEYHIIVGSFSYAEQAKAEKLVKALKEKGYPALIIDAKKRYRISVENFTNPQEANSVRDDYRKITEREDIWILKIDK